MVPVPLLWCPISNELSGLCDLLCGPPVSVALTNMAQTKHEPVPGPSRGEVAGCLPRCPPRVPCLLRWWEGHPSLPQTLALCFWLPASVGLLPYSNWDWVVLAAFVP